jgi:PilZ domain
MVDRRSTKRYELDLPVELQLEANPNGEEKFRGRTQDISTQGFFFNTEHCLSVGSKFRFSIGFPREVTGEDTSALIRGMAVAIRVHEGSGNSSEPWCVAALICPASRPRILRRRDI